MNVIVVCPCCASPVDTHAEDTDQELECVACEQTWTMRVDADRAAKYSLA